MRVSVIIVSSRLLSVRLLHSASADASSPPGGKQANPSFSTLRVTNANAAAADEAQSVRDSQSGNTESRAAAHSNRSDEIPSRAMSKNEDTTPPPTTTTTNTMVVVADGNVDDQQHCYYDGGYYVERERKEVQKQGAYHPVCVDSGRLCDEM
eukprot:GHVU01065588.1.p2 GENE.GHVU01065588.1~~GHVU01065588.1.p2  ORF type:complete len:152 (-),score=32.28 GHVU01065588.1:416-871(-)